MGRDTFKDYVFHTFNYLFFFIFTILCIYPFYYIVIYSLSNSDMASIKVPLIIPSGFTFDNYLRVFALDGIASSFFISLSRSLIVTAAVVFMNTMFAYILTKEALIFRKAIYRIAVSSMYLSAGIIPWYVTMKTLGLKDNYMLYILPWVIQAYYMILIKTYVEQLEKSLEESAQIDGAGYFTIFIKIIMPVCKPVLAAVAVFSAVGQWNYFFDNLMLVSSPKLQTMQMILYTYLSQAQSIASKAMSGMNVSDMKSSFRVTAQTIRMTIAVVATIPVICFYPFLQKYFVKGIMLGAVKG